MVSKNTFVDALREVEPGNGNAARSGILGIAEMTLWLKVRDTAASDGRVECWHRCRRRRGRRSQEEDEEAVMAEI